MRLRSVFVLAVFACFARAQDASSQRAQIASLLDFEMGAQVNGAPVGWGGSSSDGTAPDSTVIADDKTVHGGGWSVRIERDEKSPGQSSGITKVIPIDFSGKSLELRGFVRTESVSDYVGLFMWEDRDSTSLEFDNMQGRRVNGTAGWTEYSIKLPLRPAAKQLSFGFKLAGTGKAWVDDLQLLVDGKPIREAPERSKLPEDHEFDLGSKNIVTALTPLQIQNLVTLGKVWGFLKYHHPAVTAGMRQWDYDLFRVLPTILAARDRAAANSAMVQWVNSLGPVAACVSCSGLNTADIQMRPDIDWISRESVLGRQLSTSLMMIYRNRTEDTQFYVAALRPGPIFQELSYNDLSFPDAGYQLLALYHFWNIIEYWFPHRDVLGEDWDQVLAEFVPRLALAKDFDSYRRELLALIARTHTTHATLSTSRQVQPPAGTCRVPVAVRLVENRFVIAFSRDGALRAADVLLELDGRLVADLVKEWTPYYSGSNDAALMRNISGAMMNGACDTSVSVRVQRGSAPLDIEARRVRLALADQERFHDLPGDAFRLLSPDIGYLKISTAKAADKARYLEAAAGTKGLVIDVRNYPSDFRLELGQHLVDQETVWAREVWADMSNPGAFHWAESRPLRPQKPYYPGKIVILVDEVTQSAAENFAMGFRASPNAIVIGSTTAGATGGVSQFPLPGGLSTGVEGTGTYYPDKRPTQRVGIVPDVTMLPTIAGIREGRDEVLEQALRQILGANVPEARIRELSKP